MDKVKVHLNKALTNITMDHGMLYVLIVLKLYWVLAIALSVDQQYSQGCRWFEAREKEKSLCLVVNRYVSPCLSNSPCVIDMQLLKEVDK